MSFNDDEPIVAPPNAGSRPTPIVAGRVQLVSKNNREAPLEKNTQKAMLELTGGDSTADRSGLDLVAVLDVSGSMQGEKIDKMKTAMQFVVKKLSPIDRLSIVTFSDAASRLCPLRQITDASKADLQGIVEGLNPGGNTNITDGLNTGLKVLADRRVSSGRVVGVMLMSDGQQNRGGDAAQVAIAGNVPVYTFGFGSDYDPTVLNAVAKNSMGGTFSVVDDVGALSMAFSQCLAGLLTVVVQDLKLTVTRVDGESEIQKVTAGNYPQAQDNEAGSVTVSFGDLYSKEVRKVIVDLLLPDIESDRGADILEVTYSYKTNGKLFDAPPATLTVRRTGSTGAGDSSPADDPPVVVQTEMARLKTATMITEARAMADGDKLGDARDKLVEAQNGLEDVLEQSNPVVEMLRTELQQLLKLFRTQEVYNKQGRPYAMSSETSHARQRFAARGDIESMRMFATPRMDKYLEQAKKFDENPAEPVPSADDDVKEEIAANPLAPIAGPIAFYIQAAIQALQAIEKIITNGSKPV
ncbi:uncharacterized protein LOC100846008 [Brachypodium distachyon]|uniref:VWFA domain-containing protein n=1 Tax=Brachypodium distachyon TaxID=15368 RepID=I1I6Z1_BRADI|nr:uncharacterized protein LOC100846008 [Brachypodium distachyon]KQJ98240.1 hypothetical protein BRADI_3g35660v3 [Brachypodium distachyon]|eukprot:XP_010235116.1 uncharacterized protein LOC100846008 [Brachypodium distachyon]